MRFRPWKVALLLFFAFLAAQALQATNVGGTYSTNQNWTLAGSPYIATSTVTIAAAATLTIDPGVIVKFNTGVALIINGKLTAIGSTGSPITFTSSAATPAPGNWQDIRFVSGSNPASRISYATISYGGATNSRSLYLNSSSPTIDHVTVSYSSVDGIRVNVGTPTLDQVTVTNCTGDGMMITGTASTPTVTNSTFSSNGGEGIDIQSGGGINLSTSNFTNNTSYGIKTVAGTRLNGLTGLTFSGNGSGTKDGIQHAGGTISINEVWHAGPTWFVTAATTVAATWSLTIDPGTTMKLSSAGELTVLGKLTAIGTTGSPIVFTSAAATPASGDWRRVSFGSGSSSASRLAYATVSYGGVWYGNLLHVTGSTPTIDHVTVSYSLVDGIRVTSGSPILDQVTATNCVDDGMVVDGATSTPAVTNSTFSNNGAEGIEIAAGAGINLSNSTISGNTSYAVLTTVNTRLNGLTGMTVTGNGGGAKDGINYSGGTLNTNETWHSGMTWFVTAGFTLGSANTLTIDAGTTVKVSSGVEINIGGKLTAIGTAVNPIVFTTAATTPAPGGWKRIYFSSTSNPLSQLSYVTISYAGGSSGAAGLYLSTASPALDHVTVSYSAAAGLSLVGASNPVVSNCTFSNNATYGIQVAAGNSITLTDSTINNNGDYAISAVANANLNGLTGLTVTGNGVGTKDAIAQGGGTITGNETWRNALPWVVTSSPAVQLGATLTIQPGTTVKFTAAPKWLTVSGKLTAVGTASSPILFTSDLVSPTPGSWSGLKFAAGTDPSSRMAYATVSYAGTSAWGANVWIESASLTFDHVTFSNSATKGVLVSGTAPAPVFQNCSFIGNATGGLQNSTPASLVDARLNYWGAANGPSGSGPGSGQSVSTGVKFEPWLTTTYTDPQYINTVFVGNRTSNPTAGISLNLSFTTTLSGDWKVTIFDLGSTAIRTILGTGATVNVSWDGKNDSGVVQPNGNYSYQLESTAAGPLAAAPAKGPAIIDHSLILIITGPTASQAYFSPNANGIQDTTTITATFTFDGAAWTLNFRNAANAIVRTATGVAGSIAYTWDGKDGTGAVVADGLYTAELIVTDGPNTANASTTTTLDNTFPVAVLTSPTNNQILSNVYQNGNPDVPFVGTASDLNLASWAVQKRIGVGQWSDLWSYGCTGTSPVLSSTFCTVRTDEFTNSSYDLRLIVTDWAGNTSSPTQTNVVANFSITLSTRQLNPVNNETVTYTSVVPALPPSNPVPLTVTIKVRSKSGQIVRTLVNAANRAAGSYGDTWNGKNDSGGYIADGPYFVTASLSDGTHSAVYDPVNKYLGPGGNSNESQLTCNSNIDPFTNKAFNCTFNLPIARVVTIIVSPLSPTPEVCDTPSFCTEQDVYRPPGVNRWRWSGLDPANVFRADARTIRIMNGQKNFSRNAIVLYGTKADITTPVTGVPLAVRSGSDNQTVALDFVTFQNQPASVKFDFKNLASNSILRSVVLSGQPPGHVSWNWDVSADNGMPVAPGRYLIIATVTDALGNSDTSDILATVQE